MTEKTDGRSRAIEAMAIHAAGAWPKPPEDEDCADLLDAALASGGVVERDAFESVYRSLHDASSGWGDAAARVRRLEAALRDLLYAKQSPVDGTCPHCGSQACYEDDSDMPLGVLRCDVTGLAVITSWARGDVHQRRWDRARAVLEDRG